MSSRRTTALVALTASVALGLSACAGSPAASSTAAGDDLGLVTAGTLTVATEGTYRPFSFQDASGELTGFDVEVVTAVADELGLDIVFQQTQWDAIFAGLDAGRFDLIANQVSINPEREAKYLFTQPYTVSPSVVVVREDDDSVSSFADLAGKTTAQSLTSNFYALAEDAGATVEPVEGWAQAVALLGQGRVDATINDRLTFLDYEKTDGPTGLKIAAETDPAYSAFALAEDRTVLTAAIDDALTTLRENGTLAQISEKYFGDDVTR